MYVASLTVRRTRRRLQRLIGEGAPAGAVCEAIDDLIYAHIAPLIEGTLRASLRDAKRKDPKRAP